MCDTKNSKVFSVFKKRRILQILHEKNSSREKKILINYIVVLVPTFSKKRPGASDSGEAELAGTAKSDEAVGKNEQGGQFLGDVNLSRGGGDVCRCKDAHVQTRLRHTMTAACRAAPDFARPSCSSRSGTGTTAWWVRPRNRSSWRRKRTLAPCTLLAAVVSITAAGAGVA